MVPIRKGALEALRWEYVVFSPMIKNTCPNAGTPSPGLPAERACPDAGLARGGTAAITPAASASTDTNITPNLGRIRHPAFSAGKARRVRSAHHRHRQYLPHRRARGGSRCRHLAGTGPA